MLVFTTDVLVVELSVARSGLKALGKLRRDAVVRYRAPVEPQSQALCIGVVGSLMHVFARLELEFLIHYFTFLSLGLAFLAAGLALRVAEARIAPAEALL